MDIMICGKDKNVEKVYKIIITEMRIIHFEKGQEIQRMFHRH